MPKAWQDNVTTSWFKAAFLNIFYNHINPPGLKIQHLICIPYNQEKKLPVFYENHPMKKYFKADFVCFDSIIVELKSKKILINADHQQTLNNVRATNFKLGLLINFGTPSLTFNRILN